MPNVPESTTFESGAFVFFALAVKLDATKSATTPITPVLLRMIPPIPTLSDSVRSRPQPARSCVGMYRPQNPQCCNVFGAAYIELGIARHPSIGDVQLRIVAGSGATIPLPVHQARSPERLLH